VQTWLPEDPYPLAIVEDLDDRDLDEADGALVAVADRAVRRSLAYKAELDEPAAAATVTLDDEPSVLALQLAAIAPIGPLDRQTLLEENDARTRVERLIELIEEENEVLAARLAGG
jgi:Lon protease-like protein